jgi:hypothetical protein
MKVFSFFLFISVLISCGDAPQEKKDAPVVKSLFSVAQKHVAIIPLDAVNEKEISTWNHYITLREFLGKFKTATPNEALSNALELGSLIKVLKDSIKPKPLNTPSFEARINLLENESLRLSDMTKISAIQSKEVNDQINKVFEAFSAVNSKINMVYLQENLDKGIDTPKPKFSLIKKDKGTKLPSLKKPNYQKN